MNYLEDIQEEIEVLKSDETYGIACELENKISECEECPAYYSHVCTVDDAGKTPEVCRAFICEWLRKEEEEKDERGQNPTDVQNTKGTVGADACCHDCRSCERRTDDGRE